MINLQTTASYGMNLNSNDKRIIKEIKQRIEDEDAIPMIAIIITGIGLALVASLTGIVAFAL